LNRRIAETADAVVEKDGPVGCDAQCPPIVIPLARRPPPRPDRNSRSMGLLS
jgi:hypothetical protein